LFGKILLDNENWYVVADWFGHGPVRAWCRETGAHGKAGRAGKAFVAAMCEELASRGALHPDHPLYIECLGDFAFSLTLPGPRGDMLRREIATQPPAAFVRSRAA